MLRHSAYCSKHFLEAHYGDSVLNKYKKPKRSELTVSQISRLPASTRCNSVVALRMHVQKLGHAIVISPYICHP